MKRLLSLFMLVAIFAPCASLAKSMARPGDPRLTFVDLSFNVPLPIEKGTEFRLSATLKPTQNIWEEERVFLHIVDPDNPDKILINADFDAPSPVTRWAVGELVKLGPVNLKAPNEIPPGKYKIQLGLFHVREDGVYVREKYTNPEVKDWVIGDIEFSPAQKAVEELPDLVISDFGSSSDLAKWQSRGVEMSLSDKGGAVVEYIKDPAQTIPSAILQDFFNYSNPKYSDWRKYDRLTYEIGLSPRYTVTLQIKDKAGNRFQKDAAEGGEVGKVEIDLASVGKAIDLMNVGNLSFFTYKPIENFTMTLDNIRLVDMGEIGFERAFVEFKGLSAPEKVKAGSTVDLAASFLIYQKFLKDESMFIHFDRKGEEDGFFSVNKAPLRETTSWPVGELVKEGPLQIYVPPELPPGVYNINLGFFTTQRTGTDPSYVKTFTDRDGVIYEVQPTKDGIDYVREPYINPPEAGPWTVGEIEILPREG